MMTGAAIGMTGAMRAIIADDEKHLADDLKRRLARLWPELKIVDVVHDGEAAERALHEHTPDIAFLDIRMPGRSGLDVAAAVPAGCRIVFVTAYDDHAVEAFEQAAVDYLLKPVSDERLTRCVERLRGGVAAPDRLLERLQQLLAKPVAQPLRWLKIPAGDGVRMLPVEEVCYFRSDNKYTVVMTRDSELLLRTPLKELIDGLDPDRFWQVHRGTVVNVRQVLTAERDFGGKLMLKLRDRKEKLPVSRSFAHLFRPE